MTYIYVLIDPRNGHCRYVGKADDVHRRYLRHLQPTKLAEVSRKNSWLAGLLAEGLKPEICVLEKVLKKDWSAAEQWWISYLKMIGAELTNGTRGGDGGSFPGPLNPMYGRKGAAHPAYGKPRPPELMKRIAEKNRGRKRNFTPEELNRIRAMGKSQTGEKNPFYGRKHSDETKKKWSKKRKGTKLTPHQEQRLHEGRLERWRRARENGKVPTYSINGVAKTVSEWSEVSGVAQGTITARLRRGWPVERAVFEPITPPGHKTKFHL